MHVRNGALLRRRAHPVDVSRVEENDAANDQHDDGDDTEADETAA